MAREGLFDDFWMTSVILSRGLVLPACLANVLRGNFMVYARSVSILSFLFCSTGWPLVSFLSPRASTL